MNKSLVLVHNATPAQQKAIDKATAAVAKSKTIDEWNANRKAALTAARKEDNDTYLKILHAVDGRGLIVQVLGADELDEKGVAIRKEQVN